jgi:hypothetical protein
MFETPPTPARHDTIEAIVATPMIALIALDGARASLLVAFR